MTIEEVPDGSHLVLDANILVYHFSGQSQQCRQLLRRCKQGRVSGYCTTHIALEALHRLMAVEAVEAGLIASGRPASQLQAAPDLVKGLTRSPRSIASLGLLGLRLVPLEESALARVPWYCAQYGLLANDAALLAVMEGLGTPNLATADKHFRCLAGLNVYWPSDLK